VPSIDVGILIGEMKDDETNYLCLVIFYKVRHTTGVNQSSVMGKTALCLFRALRAA